MCDRKYMFGDKSTLGSGLGKIMPKIFFCTLNKGQLPTRLM